MMILKPHWQRWRGKTALVTACGPSLRPTIVPADWSIICVNDSYRLFPKADILYACDERWWNFHKESISSFKGERWSSHSSAKNHDDKWLAARRHDLWLVGAKHGDGFCLDGSTIHYGFNSGFQAVNLALLFGAQRIVLLGFDMKAESKGHRHFFGNHPEPLHNTHEYDKWMEQFSIAARLLPPHIEIVNCTIDTAMTCFKQVSLEELIGQPQNDQDAA